MSGDNPGRLGEGVGVVANAVLSIVSSIIGGGLVLAGQFFVKRAEDKRVWLIRLQEAASDLTTSYLQEAATANDRRRAGTDLSQVETATYVVDRQKALGRFRTLPWSSDFEAHRQAMGRGIEGVAGMGRIRRRVSVRLQGRPGGSLRVHGRGRCTDPPRRRLSVSVDDLPRPHRPLISVSFRPARKPGRLSGSGSLGRRPRKGGGGESHCPGWHHPRQGDDAILASLDGRIAFLERAGFLDADGQDGQATER
jgi:hypothetical protein